MTISLSTLRAELGALELRLVDRLNGALANKADRAIMDQVVARQADGLSRLVVLEKDTIRREGPFVTMLDSHEKRLDELQALSKYRKWLWAQTVALVAIAVPMLSLFVEHRWITG